MSSPEQQERAAQFRRFHHEALPLVLPNVWDAASARIVAQAGARAIATTSSGVATALGYSDGQHISQGMLIESIARITRVVECPVTADIEAGYGSSIEEVLRTVRDVIATGAVGINIEDSRPQADQALVDISYQVELIQALRELAASLDVPFVINARVDVIIRAVGAPETRFEHTVRRANAYLQAGADCIFPIGMVERDMIANLAAAINGPINMLGGPPHPTIPELARLGVARISLAGRLMSAALGHVRTIVHEVLERGTYDSLSADSLSSAELRSLFAN